MLLVTALLLAQFAVMRQWPGGKYIDWAIVKQRFRGNKP